MDGHPEEARLPVIAAEQGRHGGEGVREELAVPEDAQGALLLADEEASVRGEGQGRGAVQAGREDGGGETGRDLGLGGGQGGEEEG
jgi:hypothetical protein